MLKLFLIIGAPGSGKTTDAQIIANDNAKIAHYSTGELLRKEVELSTGLGEKISSFLNKGELCPLNIVIDTIISALKSSQNELVLIDGFPRSIEQMIEFDKILKKEKSIELSSVIEIKVSEEVSKARVLGRARGSDDSEEVFNNRMKIYNESLEDIRDFYQDKLEVIDGERSIDEIVSDIKLFLYKKIS